MHRLILPIVAAVTALLLIGRALTAAPDAVEANIQSVQLTMAAPASTITDTITLAPTQDNTLYESELGTISNGAGESLFAGTTNNSDARRAVLAFDLGGLPPDATVLSATLALTMTRTIAGDAPVALHALAAGWGEGTSDAIGEEGAGALATPGDATWLYTFFDTDQWAAPGGDFAPTPSAVTTVGGIGVYEWSSAALLADVAGWLAEPDTNHGWILIADETAAGTAKRFASRENAPADRPHLTITYTATATGATAFVPAIFGE